MDYSTIDDINELRLEPKQRLFAIKYASGQNATEAAKEAGYAKGSAHITGYRLKNLPKVKRYIDLLIAKGDKDNLITIDWIIKRLVDIVNNDKANTSDKLRALELLGKNKGAWNDNPAINIAVFGQLEARIKDKLGLLRARRKTESLPMASEDNSRLSQVIDTKEDMLVTSDNKGYVKSIDEAVPVEVATSGLDPLPEGAGTTPQGTQ